MYSVIGACWGVFQSVPLDFRRAGLEDGQHHGSWAGEDIRTDQCGTAIG